MNEINSLIASLQNLGPEAIRSEIERRAKEIKALQTLLRAAIQTRKKRDHKEAAR